jgi:hypothetical protein
MAESGLTKNNIINELSKSPHGKLDEYLAVGTKAVKQEPEFMAHLIAWNQINGQVRDAKVALPVISLADPSFPEDFVENSLAHVASLDARNMLRALRFSKQLKARGRAMRRMVAQYLGSLESNWAKWERVAVQHRKSLKGLYAFPYTGGRIKLVPHVKAILFENQFPKGSLFYLISQLKNMSPSEAAGTILEHRIPSLIAKGALGEKAKNPDVVMALIDRMSATELVTNIKMLEELGLNTNPALRAAFEQALQRAAKSKQNTLKTSKAAESVKDEGLKAKLQNLQEKQIKALGGIDGNWLVLGDKSGSMSTAIEMARHVASTLAKMVNGDVHIIFFDTSPRYGKATGCTYEEILAGSKHVTAGGGTSIGCGLQYLMDNNIEVDGIAIVTDGDENTNPYFGAVYQKYAKKFDKEPTVYVYQTPSGYKASFSANLKAIGIDVQDFKLSGQTDYYSLPNLVQTMRVNRYGLVDQIMETPLLTLDGVLKNGGVHAR